MAEENYLLNMIYDNWKGYQNHIRESVAPLTAEQLALRAAPDLRTIGENTAHIIGCRAGWFNHFLGEDGGAEIKEMAEWDVPGAPPRSAAELAQGLDRTWQFMAGCIARWSDADMQKTFPDDWDGKKVDLSRAWVIWHVLEHDLHHGGELSFTLGIHGIPADFPG